LKSGGKGRGGGGRSGRTVQQYLLHGTLFSNFAFGPIGSMLERITDFAQMKGSDVSVALIVPFRRATPKNKLFDLDLCLISSLFSLNLFQINNEINN